MSRFLAPIHSWLFNKIIIAEELEKNLLQDFASLEDVKNIEEKANELYGYPLEDKPLEELVDSDNIHGWLQGRIASAETRQAYIIGYMIAKYGIEAKQIAEDAFKKQGEKYAEEAKKENKLGDAIEIYNALNACILEGMPCDNVNNTTIKEPTHLQWENIKCLHRGYWEAVNAPVEIMYELRYDWIRSFVETANVGFTHKAKREDEIIIQDIINK